MTVKRRVVVVGAGMGGLAASIALSTRGFQVTTLDAADGPGRKDARGRGGRTPHRRRADCAHDALGVRADLRGRRRVPIWKLALNRTMRLARHAWGDGSRLDLYSDVDQSAEAIADFAGAREADGYRGFCKRAESIYRTLRDSFICGSRPGPVELATRVGLSRLPDLMRISPFTTLARALEDHFADPRLRQLVRAIRHLLRLVAVPRACDPHAGCSRRARGRLDRRRRHGAPRRGAGRAWRELEARNSAFASGSRGSSSRTGARQAWRRTRANG